MRGVFRSRYDLVATRYQSGVSDYTDRATAHHATAQAMRETATKRTPDGVVLHWENYQDLRLCTHEENLADECLALSFTCHRYWYRASNKAHAHRCLCQIRSDHPTTPVPVLSLAEVSRDIERTTRNTSAPPGPPRALSVLATCHASNAPGVSARPRMEIAPT